MNLLFDQGNSRLKWAVAEAGGRIVARGAVLSGDLAAVLSAIALRPEPLQQIAVASVASADSKRWLDELIRRTWGIPPVFCVSGATVTGLKNGYTVPARLGVDRWLAMRGARAAVAGVILVVDAGTALTLDAIAADGAHLGGYIVPGYAMQLRALGQDTAGVGCANEMPGHGLGRDTGLAVANGVLLGLVALIDRAERDLSQAVQGAVSIVMTGGDAGIIAPSLASVAMIDSDLLFRGMVADLASMSG